MHEVELDDLLNTIECQLEVDDCKVFEIKNNMKEKDLIVVTTFVACDGREFTSKELCLKYEQEKMKEMGFVDIRKNAFLSDLFVENTDYTYSAYKFTYNSNFSLRDYVKFLGWKSELFETIIDGELKYNISLKNMPSLKAGETYVIVSYRDDSTESLNPTYWYLYNLKDFRDYHIKNINRYYDEIKEF